MNIKKISVNFLTFLSPSVLISKYIFSHVHVHCTPGFFQYENREEESSCVIRSVASSYLYFCLRRRMNFLRTMDKLSIPFRSRVLSNRTKYTSCFACRCPRLIWFAMCTWNNSRFISFGYMTIFISVFS